jgi:hypothetical protein
MIVQLSVTSTVPALAQTPQDWGKADKSGVQMRLEAVRKEWQSSETPSLTLDLRNTGIKTALYLPVGQEFLIEVDGHWYAWWEAIPLNMPAMQLFPGKEKDGAVTIELTEVWFTNSGLPDWDGVSAGDSKGIIHLKLSPGKHTVRVKFRPGAPITITAISNPTEFKIEAYSTSTTDSSDPR